MHDHRVALARLALAAGEIDRIDRYLGLVAEWSKRVNLTAARSAQERVDVLVRPALDLRRHLQTGSLLDVGSGNGSPGLILALLEPARPAVLLEPRARRWAFLREAARQADRSDVQILRERHDQYRGQAMANVLLRGLRLPLAEIEPLIASGGQALLSGSAPEAALPELIPGVFVYRPHVSRET
jgi:16S rRNA (guanine527-N7)-methyltransferase